MGASCTDLLCKGIKHFNNGICWDIFPCRPPKATATSKGEGKCRHTKKWFLSNEWVVVDLVSRPALTSSWHNKRP